MAYGSTGFETQPQFGPSLLGLQTPNYASLLGMGGGGAGGLGGLLGGAGALLGGPLALPLALSFGPALLSKLFGGESPEQKLRKQLMQILNPSNQANLTEQFYRQNLGSPGFSTAQSGLIRGSNLTQQRLATSLGARGLRTSGVGSVVPGLASSALAGQMGNLYTQAHQGAQQQAQANIHQQIAALTGTQGPSQSASLFAGGLESFSPFLQAFLQSKFPGMQFQTGR